ncbi:MAG: PAS domain S-box protein [Planctomycetota bacterium]|nr:PAS domain S-box protein [Planctomycetota bacterium]
MRDLDAGGRNVGGEIQALHSRITKLEQVSHNLSTHKNVDDELDKAWHEWETTFDAIKDSIILTDNEFRIVQANRAASQLFGKSLDEIIGKTCWHLVHGIDQPPKECPLKKAKGTKKHEEIELYLPQKGIWVTDSVDPILDEQGGLTGAVHIIRDITDRKQAERLLRKERDRAQSYLDVAGVMLVAIDAEQRVGLINKKGCDILGYPEEDVIAKNWFDNFLPQRVREQVRAIFEKTVRCEVDAPEYYENPILTKNGDEKLIAWHNTILRDNKGQVIATLSSGEDITERKRSEEALRESEEKYRDLFENAREAIVTLDLKGDITGVNKLVEEYGFKREELIGKSHFDFIAEKYRSNSVKEFERLTQGIPVVGEVELITPKGNMIVEYRNNPIRRGGQIVGIQEILIDITERKKAEEALRETSDYLQNLIAYANAPIIVWDPHFRITQFNRAFESLTGRKASDVIGKSLELLFPPAVVENTMKLIRKTLTGERWEVIEISIQHIDGSVWTVLWNSATIFAPDGKTAVAIIAQGQDITERKKAEERVKEDQAQLKSLASQLTLSEEHERRRLAAELHDRISQSLVISKIKLDALRKSGHSRKLDKLLEEVCNSIGQTIQDTRTLTFDLGNPVLYELGFEVAVSEWLTNQIQEKHGIPVDFEDDGEAKPLDNDIRVLLFRDVRELLINVVKHAGARKVKVSISKLGEQICITVEDDGVGFDPAEVTSMAARRGEFGLFSIRERLDNLGGHLQIDSAPGQGCKVTMTAPLKRKEMTR